MGDVVNFFNQKGKDVKMVSKRFTSNDWHFVYSSFPNKAYIKEKIFGILYFSILQDIVYKRYRHPVVMCIESHIDITRAQKICNKLAEINNFKFNFSYGHQGENRDIQMADYIAAAGRKMKRKKLEKYNNFIIDDRFIPSWVYRKIFK